MQRIRTTKERARRIDLMYFGRPHWLRQWRFWLSCAVPLAALGWLLTMHAQGGQRAFSSGPLSRSHAVFTRQCELCHLRRPGYFEAVADQACLSCHDAPLHHASQTFTPACSSCHLEHKGTIRLASTADSACTQCHVDLHAKGASLHVAGSIRSFEQGHPEFAAAREGTADPGGIKLNHRLHMQALLGPHHTRVQLTCEDCHRNTGPWSGKTEVWRYAGEQVRPVIPTQGSEGSRPSHGTPGMASPRFVENCAGCHLLEFDRRFGQEQVPHDKPDVLHAYLEKRFTEYIVAHPGEIPQAVRFERQIPERPVIVRVARNASEWVGFRVEEAEDLLWRKTCKQCHTLRAGTGPLPEIAKAEITTRWMPYAEFSHGSHQMMTCASCHTKAASSHETSDVLVPGIKTCQPCHREPGPAKEFAEGRCFECHQYHNWSHRQPVQGIYDLHQLRGESTPTAPQS